MPDSDVITLVLDQQLTRRKRWHLLYTELDEPETGSQYVGEVIDYMANHGFWVYRIDTGVALYEVSMRRITDEKD